MEDDPGGEPPRIRSRKYAIMLMWCALWACMGIFVYRAAALQSPVEQGGNAAAGGVVPWYTILTPAIIFCSIVLAGFSFFFSASEVAFLSLNKVQLRAMRESTHLMPGLIARLMRRPGSLLTTILMGNNIVNVLLSITFAAPVAETFNRSLAFSATQSYAASITITTGALLFFCEILPKVFAARRPRTFAMIAAMPLFLVDILMAPLRSAAMTLVSFLFRITRLSQVPPAPFLTDDEFISLLSDGEASGVIEEDERQMIQGILEFSDATVREILSPRPDIVAVKESATVGEALEVVREHEFARMPVYKEDLDHIIGILYAKDLLSVTELGDLDKPVTQFMRKPHFVPETMNVADFVTMAQRLRIHIAIVVDEYGGTEGLVTLQDALREVVGDIGEEDDVDRPAFVELAENTYRFAGNFPLDEFEEIMGMHTDDEEHTTVGGFLMAQSDRILEPGDELEYNGVYFKIEEVNEKRIARVFATKMRQTDDSKEAAAR
ncbi:MAG TPA: HlyC/CorC family transporter [Candidatus Hydrogenedentes bacterium]|nr:HlyC/CorC family transporter [Candidatus Hydrogenedentota bacterium]